MKDAAKDAYELSYAQEALKVALSAQEVANEKIKNQIDLLKKQAENSKKTTSERRQNLDEAFKMEEDYFKKNGNLANKAMENAIKDAKIKGTLHAEEVANLKQKGTEYAATLLKDGKIEQEQFDAIKEVEQGLIKLRKEHKDVYDAYLDSKDKLANEDKEAAKAKKDKDEATAKEAREKRAAKIKEEREKRAAYTKQAHEEELASIARMESARLSGFAKEVFDTQHHFAELISKVKDNKKAKLQLEKEEQQALSDIRKKFIADNEQQLQDLHHDIVQIAIDTTTDLKEKAILQAEEDKRLQLENFSKKGEALKNVIEAEKAKLLKAQEENSKEDLSGLKDLLAKQQAQYERFTDARLKLETKLQTNIDNIRKGNVDGAETNRSDKNDTTKQNKEQEDKLTQEANQYREDGHETKALTKELELLKMHHAAVVDAKTKNNQAKEKIDQDYAKKRLELEGKIATSVIHSGDKLINAALANSKKGSAIHKAAFLAKKATSIGDTIISTRQAVMDSLKAYSSIPFIGTALGIAQAAFMAAQGASSIAEIVKQKPGMAQGGYFKSDGRGAVLPGYSRTDNTNAYLRSGEAVVVSEAMRNPWARNLVSAINVAHGGRDFSVPNNNSGYAVGGIFTDGGNANRYYSQPMNDTKDLANTLAYQMINNFPPIYVDVKDVNNQQSILAQTINRVNL